VANQTSTDQQGVQGRAAELAGTAKQQTQGVVGDARQEASAVMSEAGTQARSLLDQAVSSVRHQADDGTGRAAEALGGVGTRLQALARGDTEQAGDIGRYAEDLGNRLSGAAQRLGDGGIDGIVDEVQRFGRRRPGLFLAAAAVSGFAAGRLLRGAKADAASTGAGSSSDWSDTTTDTAGSLPPQQALPGAITPDAIPAGGSAAEVSRGATGTVSPGPDRPTGVPASPTTPVPPYGSTAGGPEGGAV
jgi:hypothetical protein